MERYCHIYYPDYKFRFFVPTAHYDTTPEKGKMRDPVSALR